MADGVRSGHGGRDVVDSLSLRAYEGAAVGICDSLFGAHDQHWQQMLMVE